MQLLKFTRICRTSSWDDGMEFSLLFSSCSGFSGKSPPFCSLTSFSSQLVKTSFSCCTISLASAASTLDMIALGLVYKQKLQMVSIGFQENCGSRIPISIRNNNYAYSILLKKLVQCVSPNNTIHTTTANSYHFIQCLIGSFCFSALCLSKLGKELLILQQKRRKQKRLINEQNCVLF